MGLPTVLYPPPDERGFDTWFFDNHAQHVSINQAAAKQNLQIGSYLIYPATLASITDFLEQHQRWHNDMNAALGIAGNDLSQVDFNNDKEKDAWMFLHYQEHLAAVTKLGGGL